MLLVLGLEWPPQLLNTDKQPAAKARQANLFDIGSPGIANCDLPNAHKLRRMPFRIVNGVSGTVAREQLNPF
jgi:hypothetical protein